MTLATPLARPGICSMPENRWQSGSAVDSLVAMHTLSSAEMVQAMTARDSAYDGLFVFAVRTTGIFCRPSCPARRPLAGNVQYFADAKAARAAGYRPCKRCRPADADAEPSWAQALLAEVAADPGLRLKDRHLRRRGLDPTTVRRHFQRRYGMTFQAYSRAQRLAHAFEHLKGGGDMDSATFDSGFDSHSGFRQAFSRLFRRAPGAIGDQDCLNLTWLTTPLGPMVAGATAEGVCLLEFAEPERLATQLAALDRHLALPRAPGHNRHLQTLARELGDYFEGRGRRFSVPLVLAGTPFQRRVWQALLTIAHGETRSYQDIARAIGRPAAVRAVGRANGGNRIAIIVPCHRVVNKGGGLGGYGGGLRRKQYLLALERAPLKADHG